MGSDRRRRAEVAGFSQEIRFATAAPPRLVRKQLGNSSRGWPGRRVRGHFPFVSLMSAASIRREGELMSEEPLGRGPWEGAGGKQVPSKVSNRTTDSVLARVRGRCSAQQRLAHPPPGGGRG